MLLRPGSGELRGALRNPELLRAYPLKQDLGFEGEFYLRDPQSKEPDWRKFVQAGIADDLPEIVSRSNAAILAVTTNSGPMVFTFGYGRALINQSHIVPNFGLRVALNTVDPEKLRSVDVKTFEELSLQTRRQSSQLTSLGVFELDTGRDLLRGVTGKPRDQSFASSVSGADVLALTADVQFTDLANLCGRVLDAYGSKEYKKQFGWIDQLQTVRDLSQLARLDGELIARLKAKDFVNMHLAPPEMIDWQDHEGFGYSTERGRNKGVKHYDLEVGAYVDSVKHLDRLSVNQLWNDHIVQFTGRAGQSIPQWSIYTAIVFETEIDKKLYVLSEGLWYEVDRDLNHAVDKYLRDIDVPSLVLPPASLLEKEGEYNRRAASNPDMALLDQVRATCGGAQTPIEPCDILTKRRQFVHVKKRTHSATLSHLFAQGTVSAEAFKHDRRFRADTRAAVRTANSRLEHLVPLDEPNVSQYEVVYAIITPRAKGWPTNLPFFSKLHLRQAARRLQDTGYKVGLLRIDAQLPS